MRKGLRKLVTIVLTATMALAIGAPAFAAEANYEEQTAVTATANAVEGLDQFMSYNSDMTIAFDANAALLAGYTSDAVSYVSSNIATMNQMVLDGTATPSGDFTVTSIANAQLRANGVSKIVTHWDGRVEYYLNSVEAAALQRNLEINYSIGEACLDAAVEISGSRTLEAAAGITNLYTTLLQSSLQTAISHGKGIIMTTQLDTLSGIQHIYFSHQ